MKGKKNDGKERADLRTPLGQKKEKAEVRLNGRKSLEMKKA